MIEATEKALIEAGVPDSRVYSERFTSGPAQAAKIQADTDAAPTRAAAAKDIALTIVLDGKEHELQIGADEHVLDAALNAGLDLPFSCKAGVCCTCRAKVLCGEVVMDKNFTLEGDEMAQGFVLSCQARATIIAAPSSTKNERKERDPEMHSTKKGEQWHFGMKVHIGVDEKYGLIHSLETTSAEAHDITMADKLLHGEEERVWG